MMDIPHFPEIYHLNQLNPQAWEQAISKLAASPADAELSHCRQFPKYCPVVIGGKKRIKSFAYVDSGNTLPNVMSPSLFHRLGYTMDDLKPLQGLKEVNTAKRIPPSRF